MKRTRQLLDHIAAKASKLKRPRKVQREEQREEDVPAVDEPVAPAPAPASPEVDEVHDAPSADGDAAAPEDADEGVDQEAEADDEQPPGEGEAHDGAEEEAEAETVPAADEEEGEEGQQEEKVEEGEKKKEKKKHRPGVVYLSRIPPFMAPPQLRSLLSHYGNITRLYATPEPEHIRKQRKKKGGNAKLNYTEAWVEFDRRSTAKAVAAALNNNIIGGPRRAYYHDDVWNIKYLTGFTWHHLTEKIRYESRVRDQRLRAEIAQVKRENALYLERVEKAHTARKIGERKESKAQQLAGGKEEV